MKQSEASKLGREAGMETVRIALHEHGIEAIRATLGPGQREWDWSAINADAAGADGVPNVKRLRDAYYRAYAKAARSICENLCFVDAIVNPKGGK